MIKKVTHGAEVSGLLAHPLNLGETIISGPHTGRAFPSKISRFRQKNKHFWWLLILNNGILIVCQTFVKQSFISGLRVMMALPLKIDQTRFWHFDQNSIPHNNSTILNFYFWWQNSSIDWQKTFIFTTPLIIHSLKKIFKNLKIIINIYNFI